jgi:hypothetical protein
MAKEFDRIPLGDATMQFNNSKHLQGWLDLQLPNATSYTVRCINQNNKFIKAEKRQSALMTVGEGMQEI